MRNLYIFALNIENIKCKDIYFLHEIQQIRIKNIKNENSKKRAIAAELLVLYVVKRFRPDGINLPPLRSSLKYGKPYFKENKNFHFNISHSGNWAVIAVAPSIIGVDIQKIHYDRKIDVAKRILSENEMKEFYKYDKIKRVDMFYKYWVLKESIVKANGKGLYQPFKGISIYFGKNGNCFVENYKENANIFVYDFDNNNYKIGLCVFSKEKYNICMNTLSYNEIIT